MHGQYDDRPLAEGKFLTPAALRAGLRMSFGDRWNVFWGTFFLLLVPSLLAFLTSYNTPRKVLSCRSLNYVVYVVSQLAAMACWVWEVQLKVRYGARCKPNSPLFLSFFLACVAGSSPRLPAVPA